MNIQVPAPKISGKFVIEMVSESGIVLDRRECKNLILNGGLDRLFNGIQPTFSSVADAIQFGAEGARIWFGLDGSAVSESDESMGSPFHHFYVGGSQGLDAHVSRVGSVVTTTWGISNANATIYEPIREIGFGPSESFGDQRLWSRAIVMPPIIPDPYASTIVNVYYSISIEIPPPWVDFQTISGAIREVSLTPWDDTWAWDAVTRHDGSTVGNANAPGSTIIGEPLMIGGTVSPGSGAGSDGFVVASQDDMEDENHWAGFRIQGENANIYRDGADTLIVEQNMLAAVSPPGGVWVPVASVGVSHTNLNGRTITGPSSVGLYELNVDPPISHAYGQRCSGYFSRAVHRIERS